MIIQNQVQENIVNNFLFILEAYKQMRPDLNMATNENICSVNAYQTDNIFNFELFRPFTMDLWNYIPYDQELTCHHIHLIHYYDKGYQKPHDHKNTEDFSFILYLQDSEDGHTCFQMGEEVLKIKPKKGKIIFFPSNILHWGESSSGDKKLAVGALKKV